MSGKLFVFVKDVKRNGWLGDLPLNCQKCGKDCRIVHGSKALDVTCYKTMGVRFR